MKQSPIQIVKAKFGDKGKLIAAIEAFTASDLWVSRTNKEKGLAHVSNAKLLRLHDIFTEVKETFGSRSKLIEAILELKKRVTDAAYRSNLAKYPVPRLHDMYKSESKRAKPKGAATKKAAPAKKAAAKKVATAKKPAAKKASAKKSK